MKAAGRGAVTSWKKKKFPTISKELFEGDLKVVGNHQGEDRGDAAVGDEDDGEGGHQGDGDRPLGVPRLLPTRRNGIESNKAVEACCRS